MAVRAMKILFTESPFLSESSLSIERRVLYVLKRRIITGDEQDVHTGWRHAYTRYQRAGMAKKVKRDTNQRERREGRQALREGRLDAL
jgi:hypothetical protein